MKAMILAAGYGKRLQPWTDKHPKALALVNGKSLLQRNILYLQRFGIKDVIINVHHFSNQVIDALNNNNSWGTRVSISDETDTLLETGGGLKKAAWYFEGEKDFVLINTDVLTDMSLSEMVQFHLQQKPLATLATTNRQTSRYFLFDSNNELCGWKNVKTGEVKIVKQTSGFYEKAFSGIHVISTEIFSLIKQEGKFSMVDIYLDLLESHPIKYFDHSNSKFIDAGKPENITMAEELFD